MPAPTIWHDQKRNELSERVRRVNSAPLKLFCCQV